MPQKGKPLNDISNRYKRISAQDRIERRKQFKRTEFTPLY